jgi:hypothetical protein
MRPQAYVAVYFVDFMRGPAVGRPADASRRELRTPSGAAHPSGWSTVFFCGNRWRARSIVRKIHLKRGARCLDGRAPQCLTSKYPPAELVALGIGPSRGQSAASKIRITYDFEGTDFPSLNVGPDN